MSSKNFETSYIDISQSKNVADMVFSLGKNLETGLFSDKKVILNLGEIDLERPQLLGLKSLVLGAGSELALVHSSSPTTKLVAMEMNIQVVDEKEMEEKAEEKAETVKEIVNKSNEVISDIISQNETIYSDLASTQDNQDEHEELLDNLMADIKDVKKELGDRISDEVLSKIQYVEDEHTQEPIPQTIDSTPLSETIMTEESIKTASMPEPTIIEEVITPTAQAIEPEELPPVIIDEDAEILFESKADEKEKIEPKSYISDVIEPNEELLEKQFILDDETKENIVGDTVYIKQTIRSGQVVSFDGNVVIIGNCHSGSEIIASGDITVWGVLEGIAHAGSKGNDNAIIRALKIDAIQLRIASYFARRPDRANIDFAQRTDTFTPEEARVKNGGIFIYTLNTDNQI
ncbi:MAG: septum site-determining protein MinC [Candidatus Gastranaerophilales bacterium]|nr:septum site-determining protein MinC [Candidatus Gastranaerophilales bacterium]